MFIKKKRLNFFYRFLSVFNSRRQFINVLKGIQMRKRVEGLIQGKVSSDHFTLGGGGQKHKQTSQNRLKQINILIDGDVSKALFIRNRFQSFSLNKMEKKTTVINNHNPLRLDGVVKVQINMVGSLKKTQFPYFFNNAFIIFYLGNLFCNAYCPILNTL